MNCKEIADKINIYLKLMETDYRGKPRVPYSTISFYESRCYASGRFIKIWYVSYQGHITLTKSEAEKYLAWLEQGNVGKHWKALEEK